MIIKNCTFRHLAKLLIPLVVLSIGWATLSRAALVAQWDLEKGSGTNVVSVCGSYTGAVHNVSGLAGFASSKGIGFFHVPGTTNRDYITLGSGKAFNLTKTFSLEAWFRPNSADKGTYALVLGKRFSPQYQIDWAANSHTLEFYVGGGHLESNRVVKTQVKPGVWHHLVGTYQVVEGSGGAIQQLYVDGALAGAITNAAGALASDDGPVRIGQNSTRDYDGRVNADWRQTAIYNHALSAQEVSMNYDAKKGSTAAKKPGGEIWKVPLTTDQWKSSDIRQKAAQSTIDIMSGIAVQTDQAKGIARQEITNLNNGLRFRMAGNPPQRLTAKWQETVETEIDLSAFNYCLLRYKAEGLLRDQPPLPIISILGNETVPLITSSQMILDGQWHTCIRKLKTKGAVTGFDVVLFTRGSSASLEIGEISFLVNPDKVLEERFFGNHSGPVTEPARFQCLDLEKQCNDGIQRVFSDILDQNADLMAVDGLSRFSNEKIVLHQVPFEMKTGVKNIITVHENKTINEEKVNAFGMEVPRKYFFPAGRDDLIVIPVNCMVSEAFLILVCDFPASQTVRSLPSIPYRVTDIEALAIDLRYADGETTTAFPYSIADEGYVLQRMVGAYAISADPRRELKELVVRNKIVGRNISVGAVTVNTTDHRVLPELATEPVLVKLSKVRQIKATAPSVTQKEKILTLKNAYYQVTIDCADGFAIKTIRNNWAPQGTLTLDSTSGLEIVAEKESWSGRAFKVADIQVEGNIARLTLESREATLPLRLKLELETDQTPEIKLRLQAENTGSKPLALSYRFPFLKNLVIGRVPDTWYYFPQYRNVLTSEKSFCKQPNHRGFTMQFMDVFNPVTGGGLTLMTHNLEQEPVHYCMQKNDAGASTYIESAADDHLLEPGGKAAFVERVMAFHAGDWRQGAQVYRNWVSTWYQPFKSQDKDWFRKTVLLKTHIPTRNNSLGINKTPPIYDADNKSYRLEETLKKDEEYLGMLPEIFHFFGWAYDEEHKTARDGEYSTKDYDQIGGLEKFRGAIRQLQDRYKIHVSLYTIMERYNRDTEFFAKHGDRLACLRENGNRSMDKMKVYVSPGEKEWREHIVSALKRLQAETGADILYLDVFGTDHRARCFDPAHGHKVPSEVARDDMALLKAMREAIPENVALWGEFPVTDVTSQYWDGYITYDTIPLHEYMATVYDRKESAPLYGTLTLPPNISRFIFPGLRPYVFACGTESGYNPADNWCFLKFTLFNGLALYDATWRLYTPETRRLLEKSLKLQKEHIDCFTSTTPEMFVPTQRAAVYANKFPGKNRTLWTLYNARYQTISGEILAVEHHNGDTYDDLWNGNALEPKIEKGYAMISLKLAPQGLGCIRQVRAE